MTSVHTAAARSHSTDAGSPYDAFADFYQWIVPDEQISGERFLRSYASVLDHLPPGASVLDCACGPGYDALTLAQCGLAVAASDASSGMVETARRLLASAGHPDVAVEHCRWEELPHMVAGRFDAVFCVGNSISHCADDEEMVASLRGMRDVLSPGGVLVVEARDWKRLHAERRRFEIRDHVALRGGGRGICIYVWTIPDCWDDRFRAEILVVVDREGVLEHHSVTLNFSAFGREDLLDRLAQADLKALGVEEGLPGRYVVTACSVLGPDGCG